MIIKVGALTSKPYAFTSRAWELDSLRSIDIFDTLLTPIRVDIRGDDIKRILPWLLRNDIWITDKVRFSYDGYRRQRLLKCYFKTRGGFIACSATDAIKRIASVYTASVGVFVVGNLISLDTMFSIKRFAQRWFNLREYLYESAVLENIDFRAPFVDTSETIVNNSNTLLLLGLNVRQERPQLAVLLERIIDDKTIITVASDFAMGVNVGFDVLVVRQLVSAKHVLSSLLTQAGVLYGSSVLYRRDLQDVLTLLRSHVSLMSPIITSVGVLSGIEIGGVSRPPCKSVNVAMSFYLNADTLYVPAKYSVYIGPFGDTLWRYSDIVLSDCVSTEVSQKYLSNVFEVFEAKQLTKAPGGVRPLKVYLRALDIALLTIKPVLGTSVYAGGLVAPYVNTFNKVLLGVVVSTKLSCIFNIECSRSSLIIINEPLERLYNEHLRSNMVTRASLNIAVAVARFERNKKVFL